MTRWPCIRVIDRPILCKAGNTSLAAVVGFEAVVFIATFDKLEDERMNEFTVAADVLTLDEALDSSFNIEQPKQ